MNKPDFEQRSPAPDGRPPEDQPPWRDDFPIDWPQDQYVVRREFTKFMVLTSFAFVVGQIWIGVKNWFRSQRPKPEAQRLARLDQVKEGDILPFRYPGENDTCLLVRLPNGSDGQPRLLAYDQKCTHLSCGVIPELKNEEGQPLPLRDCRLLCPCHHGVFDLENGRPMAGPPRRPLPRIELDIRDGDIYATGVEERTV